MISQIIVGYITFFRSMPQLRITRQERTYFGIYLRLNQWDEEQAGNRRYCENYAIGILREEKLYCKNLILLVG